MHIALSNIDRHGDAYLISPFKGHFLMGTSETNGIQPCQTPKENSPTIGLLRFLVARGRIEPEPRMFDPTS